MHTEGDATAASDLVPFMQDPREGDAAAGTPEESRSRPNTSGDAAAGAPRQVFDQSAGTIAAPRSSAVVDAKDIQESGTTSSGIPAGLPTSAGPHEAQVEWLRREAQDTGHRALLEEAQVRSEQQEMARRTMLSMADVIEDLNAQKRLLMRQLLEEQQSSAAVLGDQATLVKDLDHVTAAFERQLGKELFEKAADMSTSGNRYVFSMMLEKSRQGFRSNLFGPNADQSLRITSIQDLQPGDIVTFKLLLFIWRAEVVSTKKRLAEEAAIRERKQWEADLKRYWQEEMRHTVAQWQEHCRQLEDKLNEANKRLKEYESRFAAEESEFLRLRSIHDKEKNLLLQAQEKLSHQLAETRGIVVAREQKIETMTKDFDAEKALWKRREQDLESEVSRLQSLVRKLTGELDQTVVLAKHMRETSLKIKRDAAKSVPQDKFAQLIYQLEHMRDQMASMSSANEHLKQDRCWLQDKLDRNKRRLELERQFLPLVHLANGPLGSKRPDFHARREKGPLLETSDERSVATPPGPPAGGGGGSPDRKLLATAQSLPTLPGATGLRGGGVPLGGSLMGGGV